MESVYQFAVENPGLTIFAMGLWCFLCATAGVWMWRANEERKWRAEFRRVDLELRELGMRTERRKSQPGAQSRPAKMEWSHQDGLRVTGAQERDNDRAGERFREDLAQALERR